MKFLVVSLLSRPALPGRESMPTTGLPLSKNEDPVVAGGAGCGDTAPVEVPELATPDPELARLDDAPMLLCELPELKKNE
jgi:hypothetical protein